MTVWKQGYKMVHQSKTGTPAGIREREVAAGRSSEVVTYHMDPAEMLQYLKEKYGEGEVAAMGVTRDQYLQLRAAGRSRRAAMKELGIASTASFYLLLDRWGLRNMEKELREIERMTGKQVKVRKTYTTRTTAAPAETATAPEWFNEGMVADALHQLITDVHTTARAKGWHDPPVPLPVSLVLIHSEVSEAVQADRKHEGSEAVAEELADVIIRVLDTAAAHQLPLVPALLAKIKKNRAREYRHGGRKY